MLAESSDSQWQQDQAKLNASASRRKQADAEVLKRLLPTPQEIRTQKLQLQQDFVTQRSGQDAVARQESARKDAAEANVRRHNQAELQQDRNEAALRRERAKQVMNENYQLAQQRREERKTEKMRAISDDISARETFADRWGGSLR